MVEGTIYYYNKLKYIIILKYSIALGYLKNNLVCHCSLLQIQFHFQLWIKKNFFQLFP